MRIELDHFLVPSRDKLAAARLLADLLNVPWSPQGIGPFAPVYVNDGLTLDFDETEAPFETMHYCFRVSEADFDAILGRIRAKGLAFRSSPHGPVDHQVDAAHGGRIVYWGEPDGHVWELLTVRYDVHHS